MSIRLSLKGTNDRETSHVAVPQRSFPDSYQDRNRKDQYERFIL